MSEQRRQEHGERATGHAVAGRTLFLLRFSGDVTTKAAPTRRRFIKRMLANVRDALRSSGAEFEITRTHNRIFVSLADPAHAEVLGRIFGIQSLARVEERGWREEADIVAAGSDFFGPLVTGRTFAVRARRVGDRKHIAVRSDSVQRALGAALAPLAAGVDLGAPEVTASLEIMPDRVYLFDADAHAPAGLPLGCEGNAVALVSGGFDSPVAAWQMMRRGVDLDYVFCNLGGREHQLETLRVMKIISDRWAYGTHPRFHAVDFDAVTRELQAKVTTRFWQVVLKRLMLRAAEQVAAERDACAIITGEAVGQVSSQTLQNLAVISSATPLPILRPVVGFNKQEIIDLARRIGTHDLSARVGEYCAMVPSKPATRATQAQIDAEEAKIDLRILDAAIAERSVFDLRRLDLASMDRPEIQTDRIEAGVSVIDLRSKAGYQGWHYPDALFLDFQHALRAYPHFDPESRYVLYCEFGLKSGHLAELMREAGLDAVHFAGGLKALIAYAREHGIATPEP